MRLQGKSLRVRAAALRFVVEGCDYLLIDPHVRRLFEGRAEALYRGRHFFRVKKRITTKVGLT